jgi:hypothetical protein
MTDERNQHDREPPPPGILDVFKSVGAAFFGVQSERNRQRDFSKGKLHHYVLAGAVATVAFVLVLYGIVQLILANVGVR